MTPEIQQFINHASDVVLHTAMSGGFGALCARTLTFLNITTLNGAVFGAVSSIVSKIFDQLINPVFNTSEANLSSKVIGIILSAGLGIAASAALATTAGFTISFAAAAALTVSIAVVKIIVQLGLELSNAVVN